ncbi:MULTISPECIES: DUF397 domain-containing protein [unclassified Streptomyces]|uniref:DUF397 domain-containing protein n=1 Tax=unclassified Streptomyces TaxID=2593676 RepID=UPI002258BE9B|nr:MULTISPECIES: DUF397 domain-containing protein [unclassified Streptomyces]MCX5145436.1 DUF397 domain-containing protein [Streptomyces sp. NBC_00320]WSN48739.1 DUF397 domain-containing protein [Streptomyces sp. NBC_01296]
MSGAPQWFKSSYSSDSGSQCIEVAHNWYKSSYSNDSGGACVEVATCAHAVRVRDSKDLAVPPLAVAPRSWADFTAWAAR